jgi:hypothetical protein
MALLSAFHNVGSTLRFIILAKWRRSATENANQGGNLTQITPVSDAQPW